MSDPLEKIGRQTRASLETATVFGGSAWSSKRTHGPALEYEAELPSGLHIACGTGSLTTVSKDLGGFNCRGLALTALYVPENDITFKTKLSAGDNTTLGLHIPIEALEAFDTSVEEAFSLFEHEKVFALTGADAKHALGLLAPIDGRYQGSARDLMLQARALELLAVVVASKRGEAKPLTENTKECKAIEARDYLETCLETPPKLEGLARAVGLNTRSLTEVFRAKFGETIGDYVTRRRMELAIGYLEQGTSVSETAYKVGYQPNAFTTAFTRWYGVPPTGVRLRH